MAQSTTSINKKTIYLVRHGETEFNRLGIVQGSGVDSELNETGLKQAAMFYERYRDVDFDHVYISALRRTRQSVSRFIEKGIPYTALPELNEISWGKYEGQGSRPTWKEEYQQMVNEWSGGNLGHRIPGGENPLELQERQKIALQHILRAENQRQILICMHGRAMKSFLCLLLNKPLSEMEDFVHSNLGLYILSHNGKTFDLIRRNCLLHLDEVIQNP